MRIEAKAPTRIDLAGATLDIWPLYLFFPGALTVNCAISRYASCTIESRGDKRILLEFRDTKRGEQFASLEALAVAKRYQLPLLANLVRHFAPAGGFSLTTDSEAPAGAGIGGSSAMAVAICAALDRFTGKKLTRVDWIHISRDVEAIVINVPTGTQDHYPPAFGGVNAIHLDVGQEWRESLPTDVDALESRLAVCYTGKPRQSGINNWLVFQAQMAGDKKVRKNLAQIAAIATFMRAAVAENNWSEAARLMREEWSFRRRNLPTISTPAIDAIISGARRKGALAGKVCGAGGGGCVALLIEPEARAAVNEAIASACGEVLPMTIDRHGVRVKVTP